MVIYIWLKINQRMLFSHKTLNPIWAKWKQKFNRVSLSCLSRYCTNYCYFSFRHASESDVCPAITCSSRGGCKHCREALISSQCCVQCACHAQNQMESIHRIRYNIVASQTDVVYNSTAQAVDKCRRTEKSCSTLITLWPSVLIPRPPMMGQALT